MNQTNKKPTNLIYVDPKFDPRTLANYSLLNVATIIISALMMVPTFISMAVFAHPNLKDPAFKILLSVATLDFIYMIMTFVVYILDTFCEPMPYMCGSTTQLWAFVIDQLFNNFLTSDVAVYSILSEIFLTIQRLLLLKNIRVIKDVTVKTTGPILGIISLLYYSPYWFAYDFVTTGNVYVYRNATYVEWNLVITDFATSPAGSWFLSSLSIFRMILVMVVMLAINIASIFAFRKYFSKKVHLTGGAGNLII
jgi:hypothetical protein